jgi:hypothetical protein
LPVRILLDSDEAGEKEMKRYKEEFFLLDSEVSLLGTHEPTYSEIEDIFSPADKRALGVLVGKETATKKDILVLVPRAFGEPKKASD